MVITAKQCANELVREMDSILYLKCGTDNVKGVSAAFIPRAKGLRRDQMPGVAAQGLNSSIPG
jgi:hypothetical protein